MSVVVCVSVFQCSVTCGLGIRVQHVRCEQRTSPTSTSVVDDSLCLEESPPPEFETSCEYPSCDESPDDHAPLLSRDNHLSSRDQSSEDNDQLSLHNKPPSSSVITSINYNTSFIQLGRADKVSMLVGGSAVLIPGSTVLIHCTPHHHGITEGKVVRWTKDGVRIEMKGRVKVTESGLLRIRTSRSKDRGLYGCVTEGGLVGDIQVEFHTVEEASHMAVLRLPFLPGYVPSHVEGQEEEQEELKGGINLTGRQGDSLAKHVTFKDIVVLLRNASTPVSYVPSDWSPCLNTCGNKGQQRRNVSCEIVQTDYSVGVDESYCLKRAESSRLIDIRECESSPCQQWSTGLWTNVSQYTDHFNSRLHLV